MAVCGAAAGRAAACPWIDDPGVDGPGAADAAAADAACALHMRVTCAARRGIRTREAVAVAEVAVAEVAAADATSVSI